LKCFAAQSVISWHTQFKRFKLCSSDSAINLALDPVVKGAA
ncbi:GNAT family N-acetyltransferase, partial [Campylobacter upsaliensis]|nr:GNAT family N-acetyltransferase [Campylobacter upsaliensis]